MQLTESTLHVDIMHEFRHKTLGTFKRQEEYNEIRWETVLELPAFAAFCYMRNGKRRRSKKVPVAICSDDEPTQSAFKMLQTITRSQKQLVKNICNTFFDDLRQQGYDDSGRHEGHGMWWSRDPVTVALACREALLKRRKRERMWEPEDLFAVLYEPSIEIFPSMIDDGVPRTLIDFGAEFEDEHGVSVLTDGKRVLNLGYSGEARRRFSGNNPVHRSRACEVSRMGNQLSRPGDGYRYSAWAAVEWR